MRLRGDHPSMPCHDSSITIAHWMKHGTTLRNNARRSGVGRSTALQGESRRQQAPYQLRDRTSEESHGRTTRWSNGSILCTDVLAGTHEECNVCHRGHEQENRHWQTSPDVNHGDGASRSLSKRPRVQHFSLNDKSVSFGGYAARVAIGGKLVRRSSICTFFFTFFIPTYLSISQHDLSAGGQGHLEGDKSWCDGRDPRRECGGGADRHQWCRWKECVCRGKAHGWVCEGRLRHPSSHWHCAGGEGTPREGAVRRQGL